MLWGKEHDLPFLEAQRLGDVEPSEERAIKLLSTLVTGSVLNDYLYTGELLCLGSVTGDAYHIRRKETVKRAKSFSESVTTFCIHSSRNLHLPPTDDVFTLYLLISFQENMFLDIANKSWERPTSLEKNLEESDLLAIDMSVWKDFLPEDDGVNSWLRDIRAIGREVPSLWPEIDMDYNPALDFGADSEITDAIDARIRLARRHPHRDRNRNNYLYRISDFSRTVVGLDLVGGLSIPRQEGSTYITHAIAAMCLAHSPIEDIEATGVDFNTEQGRIHVPIVEWNCGRDIDDAFLHLLMSAYAGRTGFAEVMPEENENIVYSKVIMSRMSYERITGEIFCGYPLSYIDNCMVLIDDRVENFVFFIPTSDQLGALVYDDGITGSTSRKAGLVILEPEAVKVRVWSHGRLRRVHGEMAIDEIYGSFPEQNNRAMDYDVRSYQANIHQPRPAWRFCMTSFDEMDYADEENSEENALTF